MTQVSLTGGISPYKMKEKGADFMITCENNVFHLKTGVYSYLLRINDYGIPEHLHFGAPVQTEDADGFLCRPGLGWGSCVVLEDSDTASCLDDKALEFISINY